MSFIQLLILIWLPTIIILTGLMEVLIIPLLGEKHKLLRRITVNALILLTTLLIAASYKYVLEAPIIYQLARVFGQGIFFKIDLLTYIFMIFAGVIFMLVSIYSIEDIKAQGRERMFNFFFIITYVSTLGTLMAGDFLSFFLFFEIMTFSSYALMVHYRGDEVLEAGNVYIYMSIIGGLSILSGIMLLSAFTQSFEWTNLAEQLSTLGYMKYLIGAFFIFGFGVKAGMVPFHFWLPRIYREAPTSMNALSSGILTKVGAYGILRVFTVIYAVDAAQVSTANPSLWFTSQNMGAVVIWLGLLTMVVGVFLALLEGNMKKMLAYHSVSQMGYIIMGIGVAAYLGLQGAMGFVGSVYHIVNHGIFKALLFMVAGIVYMNTKEMDMYQLGGLWKRMPMVAVLALIAVLGITGMPGFNGFASKSILHHAIIEAYEYGHPSFKYAELIFKVVSAGTVCSFIKFISFIFLGKCPDKYKDVKVKQSKMLVAMTVLGGLVVIIGLFPSLFMDKLIIPAVQSYSYDPYFIKKYIVGMNFFNSKEILGMLYVYMGGAAIFFVGIKFHLFHAHLPKWMNAEKLIYRPVTQICEEFPNICVERYEKPLILGDVFIYAVILTGILGVLIISGIA